jgi:hypothetical protein
MLYNVRLARRITSESLAEAGVELLSDSPEKMQAAANGGVDSGALFSSFDPLPEAAYSWMALSEGGRKAMCAIIKAVTRVPKPTHPKR